jgi:hypothetical protein
VLWVSGQYAEVAELMEKHHLPALQEHGDRQEWLIRSAWLAHFKLGCGQYELASALAVAELRLGHHDLARQCLHDALQSVTKFAGSIHPVPVLPPVAEFLAAQGRPEWAVEVWALACRYPFICNSRWYIDVVGRYIEEMAATLPPDVREAAQARGRARDLWATVEELAAEMGG